MLSFSFSCFWIGLCATVEVSVDFKLMVCLGKQILDLEWSFCLLSKILANLVSSAIKTKDLSSQGHFSAPNDQISETTNLLSYFD